MTIFGPDYELNRRRAIDQARQCAKGMPVEQLVPGAIVTLSPCKHTGDRSYISAIWRVLALNAGHVALECVRSEFSCPVGKRLLMVISEHEWYPAEHLLAEMSADADQSAE